MIPNCSGDVSDVFSPLLRPPSTGTAGEGGEAAAAGAPENPQRALVSIDDDFFFRCALYRLHCAAAKRARALPLRLRLAIELVLLAAVFLQLSALAALHCLLMPSPLAPQAAGPLAAGLAESLRVPEGPVELLRIDAEAPPPRGCPSGDAGATARSKGGRRCRGEPVRCEFATERALLELPRRVRERAYAAGGSQALSLTLNASSILGAGVLPRSLVELPWLAPAVLTRRVLAAMVWGPLHDEVRGREPAENATEVALNASAAINASNVFNSSAYFRNMSEERLNVVKGQLNEALLAAARWRQRQSRQATSMVDKWSILSWTGVGDSGASNEQPAGSSLLAYVSCQGQEPLSMQPLRRSAELLHRRAEWWLFKAVWTLSTGVLVLLTGVATSFTVRTALLGLFRLHTIVRRGGLGNIGDRLEALEAIVLVFCPGALILALCRIADDTTGGLTAVLFCLSMGEVATVCILRTQESRYIFPRVALPVYVADVYYSFFHPFGFTLLAHSTLYCFQAFMLCTLWSHFEAPVKLPDTCPDHLTVEVRMRPCERRPRIPAALSPQTQRLLLEQGLLLLGDDRSYESGVVMSAIVARALQATQVPPPPRPNRPEPSALVFGTLPQAVVEMLGGGPAAQTLVSCAHAGDERCLTLLGHLLSRLPPQPAQQVQAQQSSRSSYARPQASAQPSAEPAAAGVRQRAAPRGSGERQMAAGASEDSARASSSSSAGAASAAGAAITGSAPSQGSGAR